MTDSFKKAGEPWRKMLQTRLSLIALALVTFSFSSSFALAGPEKNDPSCTSLYLDMVLKNGFVTERGYDSYRAYMFPSFARDLAALGKKDILLDGGAGRANFLIDYLYMEKVTSWVGKNLKALKVGIEIPLPPHDERANAIALSFSRPKKSRSQEHLLRDKADRDPKFQYIEADISEILKKRPDLKGQVSMIVDNFGILKYAPLDHVLRVYLQLLKKGGKIYFRSPDAKIFKGDKPVSIAEYFASIKGARYTKKPNFSYTVPIVADSNGQHLIEKISDQIMVPSLEVRNSHVDATRGPETSYEWK